MERCVEWLKECKRVGTRFDKIASSFLAFVKLAIMQWYLRILDPSDRAEFATQSRATRAADEDLCVTDALRDHISLNRNLRDPHILRLQRTDRHTPSPRSPATDR